ncbi:uncharacterized protein LOC107629933 [Arachis ipaensis]|uniref:uncharacterized protein LOC107629933 n=1 Tax=Arachis ipaensis TaxID=130454 RepID=UPI000A2AF9D3|nr:uncharacterized protein LOC107629933 [Arachis ipaensis]XP_025643323.1 uncharacterized protein LOC112737575 [Arachis hypogaea]
MELLLTPPLPSVRHLYEIDDQRGEEYSNAAWMKHRSSPLSSPVVFVKPPPLSALQHRRHGVALIMLGSASCCSYLLPLFSGQPLSPGIRHDLKLLPLYVLRGALLTLVPQCEVVDDVLNVVVRMLTTTSERQRWFLPTSIMQAAIDDRSMTFGNMTSLHNKYMRSKVDRVTRIYQPMWCDRHWYLMIIDVPRKKLIYLDSLRDPHQADARKTGMMRVALYLEGLTLGKPWLSGEGALRPRFSAFDFEEPDVPQQKGNSMDCGVWVAQWMIREHLWKDYGVQHVNSATRMRLAADLVLKSHNEIAQEVVAKAFAHWEMKST